MFVDDNLRRRAGLTVLALFVARAGLHIPIPGLNADFLMVLLWSLGSQGIGRGPSGPTLTPLEPFSVWALGIQPYLAGAGLTLLASGMMPALRRRRDGDRAGRRSFDRLTFLVAGVVALASAYTRVIAFQTGPTPAIGGTSAAGMSVAAAIIGWVAAALLLAFLAMQITQRGLGNGVAWLVLFGALAGFWPSLFAQAHTAMGIDPAPLARLLGLVLLVGLVIATMILVRVERPLHFVPTDEEHQGEVFRFPLRLNIAGTVPLICAISLLQVPATAVAFGLAPETWNAFIGSPAYWLLMVVLTIGLTFLITPWIFNERSLISLVQQYGFRPQVDRGPEAWRADLQATAVRLTLFWAAFLSVFPLAGWVAQAWFGVLPTLASLVCPLLPVIAAIVFDTWRQVKQELNDEYDDWVEALEAETRLELELARFRLAREGIDSMVRINRAICVMGSLAPWEMCRPTYPALVVYRALGGGRAILMVPKAGLEDARQILSRYASRDRL